MKPVSLDQCIEGVEIGNAELAGVHGGALGWFEVLKWAFRIKTAFEAGGIAYDVYEAYSESYQEERYFDPFVS